MKIALLLGVFLFVAFSGRTVLGKPQGWLQELSTEMKHAEEEMQKAEAEAESEEKRAYADLNSIKQKCASAGGNNESVENGQTVGLTLQETNGVQQFYEQIYNPTTKKTEQKYYSIDKNDPKAKPICGKPTQ